MKRTEVCPTLLLDHIVHLQNLAYEYVDVTAILYDTHTHIYIYLYTHVISYKSCLLVYMYM